jgi:uncharacterized damage-inducible protein DinB
MTPRLAEREIRRPGANWDARPDPNRFSMREVIAHLADWEPIMLTRIRTGVDSPGATINAYDEGKMAIDNKYAEKDPIETLFKWKQDREKTIAYINGLTEDDMAKRVIHPERGEMYVKDIAHMLVSHDVYHLEQLMTMDAAMGKSVDTW